MAGRFNGNNLKRGLDYLKRNGLEKAVYKAAERIARDREEKDYNEEFLKSRPGEEELEAQRKYKSDNPFKISILVPLYETDTELLTKTLESIAGQTYGNWELCLADASGSDARDEIVREFCRKWEKPCSDEFGSIYDKVKYRYLNENKGISGNTNEALLMAEGDYIALLDHDDLLEPDALYEFISENDRRLRTKAHDAEIPDRILLAYTDEDKITGDGKTHFDRHIKPDYDPILICTNNYICHFLIVDLELAKLVGGFIPKYDGAQDHDFILRCTEKCGRDRICHIPKILYHWRSTKSSTAENPSAKLYAYNAGRMAVEDHLKRIGIKARVQNTEHLGFFRLIYEGQNESAALLSRNEFEGMSEEELRSIKDKYILVVSDKLKPCSKDYLNEMLGCMQHKEVGAVTAKIIGTNGKIESAGYDKGADGKPIPRFKDLNRHYSGYLHRASTEQVVDGFTEDLVLIRIDAAEHFHPGIALKDKYLVYYYPYAYFKRKLI